MASGARSFSDAGISPSRRRGPRASIGPRPWGRSSMGGHRRGRPTNDATYQFAGSPDRLSPEAAGLIAAQRWNAATSDNNISKPPVQRSISSGADISALRGEYRRERRFAGDRGFFSADPNPSA